jgi:hypothetical protein
MAHFLWMSFAGRPTVHTENFIQRFSTNVTLHSDHLDSAASVSSLDMSLISKDIPGGQHFGERQGPRTASVLRSAWGNDDGHEQHGIFGRDRHSNIGITQNIYIKSATKSQVDRRVLLKSCCQMRT